jgi:glutathione S-transferase
MQLRFSPTSPFVRKVRITAIEAGLQDQIEHITTDPWSAETDLRQSNPLSKVPCLITDEGDAIYDSPVICEYLDSLNTGPKLFPEDPTTRFKVLTLAAAADGMTDAGILHLVESVRRPQELKWDWWDERQQTTMQTAMTVLNEAAPSMATKDGPITIAEITAGSGLGWVDLRFPSLDWRLSNAALAGWFEKISERPSFKETVPPAA